MKKIVRLLSVITVIILLMCGCGTTSQVEDGKYQIPLTMEGGTGKAYIESPAQVIVEEGQAKIILVWSSKNYDYMIVNDTQYFNETEGEPSTFTITLESLAQLENELLVIGDTTAMSTPHEIEYTLSFGDLEKYE